MRPTNRTVPRGVRFAFLLAVVAPAAGCDDPAEPAPVEVDAREVLTVFYHELGGPDWTYRDNWLTNAPFDTWYGVETDSEGNVTGLNLGGNRLKGRIPAVLGMLTTLRNLDLRGNGRDRIAGPIPAELGMLRNLERLDLRFNRLTGSIPPELGDLHDLGYMSLAGNQLTGSIPPELGNLRNMSYRVLSSNRLTGPVPRELGNMS